MKKWKLILDWQYTYDKEGTWSDYEDGVSEFDLVEGASYSAPNMRRKTIDIRSFKEENGVAIAEIYTDYHTYVVRSDEDGVPGNCEDSYTAGGDSVSVSLCFTARIESK